MVQWAARVQEGRGLSDNAVDSVSGRVCILTWVRTPLDTHTKTQVLLHLLFVDAVLPPTSCVFNRRRL
jgi:hypothetical protein